MERIWKPINLKPFNESHLISNYGDIRVIKTNRLLKQRLDKDGYYQVNLYYNGLEVTKKVHRLVALTFLEKDYKEGLVVNHIDGIKTNNFVENLEWTTVSGNTQHAYDNGLEKKGVKHAKAKHYAIYDNKGTLISQYENTFKLEDATGKHRGNLMKTLKENNNLKEINSINYELPINKELNKSNEYIKNPIAIYDNDLNLIALYSNISSLEKNTTITRSIGRKLKEDDFYKYKKRGKEFKQIYYLKNISFIDFFILDCNIIDEKLVIR